MLDSAYVSSSIKTRHAIRLRKIHGHDVSFECEHLIWTLTPLHLFHLRLPRLAIRLSNDRHHLVQGLPVYSEILPYFEVTVLTIRISPVYIFIFLYQFLHLKTYQPNNQIRLKLTTQNKTSFYCSKISHYAQTIKIFLSKN